MDEERDMSGVGGLRESDKQRLAARASIEFFLRGVEMAAGMSGGDILRGIIFLAIVHANTRHVDGKPDIAARYSASDAILPDEHRRPVSVYAIAKSLSLSYETTRRYVAKLEADGRCVRGADRKGVYVPAAVLAEPPMLRFVQQNGKHLRNLVQEVVGAGIV